MFTLDMDSFTFELKEGTVKHVGASNAAATAKLYDVTDVESREFGDERVKLVFEDGEGNEVEVALFPAEAVELRAGLENLAGDMDLEIEHVDDESDSDPASGEGQSTDRGSDWLD
jgi:hypothetical protein